MNDELNLEPYRKAWQAEKERLQSAPPRHTEQDIAAMLSRHDAKKAVAPIQSQQHRRTLPIWIGSAAASVAILIGVAWLLWLRPTADPNVLPTLAELRHQTASPHTPNSMNSPSSPNILNNSTTPIALTTPPSIHSLTKEPNVVLPTDAPITLTEDTEFSILNSQFSTPSNPPSAQPSTNPSSTQPQIQAFQETSIVGSLNKQKTPKDPLVRIVNTRPDWTSTHSANTQIAFSGGACISQGSKPRPLVGISVTRDAESNGIICANNQAAIYLLGILPSDTTSNAVNVQYGYGLSYRPIDRLSLRVNLGGFIQFVDFHLGLRFNTEAGYRLSDDFTLTASYQYYMPGIVSGEGRHAVLLSIGYIIN